MIVALTGISMSFSLLSCSRISEIKSCEDSVIFFANLEYNQYMVHIRQNHQLLLWAKSKFSNFCYTKIWRDKCLYQHIFLVFATHFFTNFILRADTFPRHQFSGLHLISVSYKNYHLVIKKYPTAQEYYIQRSIRNEPATKVIYPDCYKDYGYALAHAMSFVCSNLFWPKKVHLKAKIDSFLTFMWFSVLPWWPNLSWNKRYMIHLSCIPLGIYNFAWFLPIDNHELAAPCTNVPSFHIHHSMSN